MGKSRIGNGLILAGLSGLMCAELLSQGYHKTYWSIVALGFTVGFIFPNF